jgi:hypothetical protein
MTDKNTGPEASDGREASECSDLLCCWCGEEIMPGDDKDPHDYGMYMHPECTEAWNDTPVADLSDIQLGSQDRPAT